MRKIIHIDMDAFYASVEQRDNPSLKGRPVIVGGRPDRRGVVAACSYEARRFGVHSAMPSSRAAKLCKEAVFLPLRFDAYKEASAQINNIFRQYTSLIEPLSLDEAFLDVTEYVAEKVSAMPASRHNISATEVAQEIKDKIKDQLNLTASAGVSYNKFLAKIASDMDKPDGLYVIRPEQAAQFVEQLEIRKFSGIGKVTEKKMHGLGIYSGGDLKGLSKLQLQTQFGSAGSYYYNIVRGLDERPVRAHRKRKSIGNETTFENNLRDKKLIWQTLQRLSKRVAEITEQKQLLARTLTIKVRYADFTIITRSKTMDHPINTQAEILAVLPELLKKTEVGQRPIRLIGVTLANLLPIKSVNMADGELPVETKQLGLFYSE